jgi:Xaa-Pro dipeptidase
VDTRNVRIAEAVGSIGADWALLTSPASVSYATGHDEPAGAGRSPFSGGPAVAVIARDGRALLVAADADLDPEAVRAERTHSYAAFALAPGGPGLDGLYLKAVSAALAEAGVGGTVALEPATCPDAVRRLLDGLGVAVVDATAALRDARAVKTAEEVERLRACAGLTAVGQRAARAAAAPGMTELELYAEVRRALDAAAGRPVALSADLLSGVVRTAAVMGGPEARTLEEGDPVICDLVPGLAGYWGDSCLSWTLGPASPGYARMYAVARRALDHAARTLRPGITAGAFAEGVLAVIEDAGLSDPIHIGHGIGVTSFEHPRLVPGAPEKLRPGMVLMVEPGAYDERIGGVRLEWMFLVTEDGNEVLSPYDVPGELTPSRS